MSSLGGAKDDMLPRETRACGKLQDVADAFRSFQAVNPTADRDGKYTVYAIRCQQKPKIDSRLEAVCWDDPADQVSDVKRHYDSLADVPEEVLEDGGWHRTRAVRMADIGWLPLWAALAANAETVFHVGLTSDICVRLAKHFSPFTESSTFHQLIEPVEPVVLYAGLSREEARKGEIFLGLELTDIGTDGGNLDPDAVRSVGLYG